MKRKGFIRSLLVAPFVGVAAAKAVAEIKIDSEVLFDEVEVRPKKYTASIKLEGIDKMTASIKQAEKAVKRFNLAVHKINIPKFAQGGIVLEPTMGLVGEIGPECYIPIEKLREIENACPITLTGRIEGNDLLLAMERFKK